MENENSRNLYSKAQTSKTRVIGLIGEIDLFRMVKELCFVL